MSQNADTQNTEMPYLVAAVMCEQVLTEKDGVVSLIRLVDTLNTNVMGGKDETDADTLPALAMSLTLFISFRAGPARGKREAAVFLYDPTGTRKAEAGPFPMVFTAAEEGHNVNIMLNLVLKDMGLYWLEIVMAGKVLSRVPMTVKKIIQPRGPEQTANPQQTSKTAE
jgi:hypothetical protein